MQTTTLTSNNSSLIIQYNDKTVKIEPDQPLNIKWINGKNGLKSVEPKKAKHLNLDVPVVSFRRVERLSKSGIARSFKMPTPYVCCAMEEEETNRNETEYDLDREDLTWLQMANARRHKAKRPSIDECTLERAIDMLEKESHFQFTQGEHGYDLGYLTMIDNDAPCCICNDGEDSNANQIIFCDICNIAVHQECYGVPYIPEGQWLCRRCQMSPSIPVDCALCSCTSGAFKQTSDGRWAHVVCAIWLNEVHFGNTVFLEPVEGVGFSIKRRRKLTCLICKRKVGACLQCSNKACVRSFHATCARYAGMKMVVKESRARNNADTITINRFAYCFQHSNPNRSGQTMASWKREMENNIKEARKMLDIKAKQTLKSVPVPVIPKEKVEDIAQKLGLNYVNDIYSYWSLKRKSRFGVPLIRRLQVYMNQQKPLFSGIPSGQNGGVDVDEAAVAAESSSAPPPPEEIQPGPATTTTAAVVVVDPLKCYAALRRNFERVRLLCELVKKREKMKHEQLLTNRAIVCKTMKPLAVLIDQTLAKLIEKDHQKIFAQPVTEKQVPGYFASVSRPMDFKRMCANNERGRYKRIADLRDDFLLMIQNCTSFNKDNHWFYNYGQRIKRIGMSVIKAAELEEQRMNEVSSMVRQAIELPILSNEAYINLCFEVDFHNNNTAHGTEPMVDTTFSEASAELLKDGKSMILDEPTIGGEGHQVQTSSSSLKEFDGQQESKPKKTDRCSSVRRTTVAGKSDAEALGRNVNKRKIALDQGGKQNSSKKVALSNSVAKKGNSLSGQETISKKGKLNQSMNRGRASVGKHADFNNVKETTTVHATKEGGQMVVDGTPQQMRTNRVRGNTDENGHSKAPVKAPRVPPDNNVQNKYMALRMNMPFLMQQKNSIGGGVAAVNRGRGVRKQTYASAYQTEASSAAESDSGNCDDILFSSIAGEEEEELPSTLTERKAAAPRRVGGGGGGVKKKFLEFGDTFVSSSPSSFAHNDIVRVEDSKFPGRVIDIRMRAIDFEDEEDDDVDGVGGGRSNFGVGRHFIDHALATKPKENETGQQPFTLILFFDKNSTCKWVSNGQIRLLYELDLNNAMLHREKDEMVVEAFEKARRFWKKVIHF